MDEVLLDVNEIQGNVLAGFNKDRQLLMALKLRDIKAARTWLGRVVPHINSLSEVGQFNSLFRTRKARLAGADPVGLVATWANIAFSHAGLAALSSREEADAIPDDSFRAGMPDQAVALGDRSPDGDPEVTKGWKVGGRGNVPEVLLIIAGDDERQLLQLADKLRPNASDSSAPTVIWEEMGYTRRDLPGHEHFGFKDGISQPAVRGLVSKDPDWYLTPRLLEPSAPGEVDFASPGNPLIWPGQFVFGYPSTNGATDGGGGPVDPPELNPKWLKNGSLLVFRRLRQDVIGFHSFLRQEAARLAARPEFADMSSTRLGAMLVGRWRSGAPVMRTPLTDLPALGDKAVLANDFAFMADGLKPRYLPGTEVPDAFPRALADGRGVVCPRASHIRKVNPRDQDTDKGDQFDTLMRRLLRRGIPYGPPLAVPDVGPLPDDDGVDRGLHFLCYQTSIVGQFEILQSDWANSVFNPKPRGVDLIIGQAPDAPREVELQTSAGDVETVSAPRQFVTTTGGGYFFAPSLSALVDLCHRS
jgi:Dyp-type peroxidase family